MAPLPWKPGPVAHRGLHDAAKGIVENTTGSVAAALAKGYAVEVDVQAARGAVPMVFHDEVLGRLMTESGSILERTPAELKALRYKGSGDRMMTLPELLEQVAGKVPLYVEVKTLFTPPGDYERQIAAAVAGYRGPLALMSFDPHSMAALRELAPTVPRGLISYRWDDGWMPQLSRLDRLALRLMAHIRKVDPGFLAYDIDDLPALTPFAMRRLFGIPLLTWTVSTTAQRAKAAKYADAIIFEGFEP